MMFNTLKPAVGCTLLPDAKQDKKAAVNCGQYRLGRLAVYYPDGTYIPYADASDVEITTKTIATSGCCGVTLPNPAVVFFAGGKKRLLLADSAAQAQRMADLLQSRA